MRHKITALLLMSALLASCSNGSSSSNEAPSTAGSEGSSASADAVESSVSTIAVAPLPEGFDPSKEENYRQAAINLFLRMKNAHTVLLLELQKNDYANPVWAGIITEKAAPLAPLYEEFEALNPPVSYKEQDKTLTASMKNIADLVADLLKAVDAMDLDAAWESVHGLQEEGNNLSTHAKFLETGGPAPTTTTTAP